ncbi:MAG: HAMP domain-containing protein [Acidobacteria bacterium]|nr:HAMP domain-containing protein [Acidobacteriota bacterium]
MYRLSIKTKLGIAIALLVMSFLLLSVGFYPRRMEYQIRRQAEISARQVAETAAQALQPTLKAGSQEGVADVLQGVKNIPSFSFCAVYDENRRQLDSTPSTPDWASQYAGGSNVSIAQTLPDRGTLLASAPIFYREALSDRYGTLLIGFTTEDIQAAVSGNIHLSLWVGLCALLLGIGAAIFLGNRYIQPIMQLTGHAQQVAHGNLDLSPVSVRSRDELGDLSRSFEMMTQRLRVNRDEIERQNRLLEYRVQERTRQLMETIWELEEIRANLEQLVQERTRGLEQSREELQAWAETLEEKVLEKTQELRALNQDLMDSYLKLQQADRMKDEFLANMSHELKTPLNAIIGFSGMLLQEGGERRIGEVREDLQVVFQNGKLLLGLIDSILDLSKIQAGRLELDLEPVDPVAILEEVRVMAQGLIGNRPLQLAFEAPSTPLRVLADPTRLRQVFVNLVGNAVKFTTSGKVRIHVRVVAMDLQVAVEDTGIGMTPEEVDRLFVPFQQVDGSITRRFGGTGLGLALSQRFMGLMNGRITVTSRKGLGSTFVVHLPLLAEVPA